MTQLIPATQHRLLALAPASEATFDYRDIAARYKRMREACVKLHKVLPQYIPGKGLQLTAKHLGLYHKGTFVLGCEDELCVLFDQAIYGYFERGENAVDRYLIGHQPQPGSDEHAMLSGMQCPFHSVFQVEQIVPDVGVHVHDIPRERRHFLADVGFSNSAVQGIVLATRVLPFEDFIMATGAALPTDRDVLVQIARLPAMNWPPEEIRGMSPEEAAELAGEVINICLRGGASEDVCYQSPDATAGDENAPIRAGAHVGRNEPCPCGSGKKYKKCCGN